MANQVNKVDLKGGNGTKTPQTYLKWKYEAMEYYLQVTNDLIEF